MEWREAIGVLLDWEGRDVVVVPFMGPGISLRPLRGTLELDHSTRGVARIMLPAMSIALPRATFIEAGWVPGRERQGLSIVQGGTRVDVFLEGAEAA